MKKTLIALAALAATSAFAQSTVTLSGSINYGVGTAVTGIHSYGNWKGDRTGITIAAVEDLGGGLKVTAAANMRFSSDTSEQSRSYVSTVSGLRGDNLFEQSSIAIDSSFGQVRVGRFTNAVGVAPLHPFEDSGQSTAPHQAANGRYSSQVQYVSPTVGGFQVEPKVLSAAHRAGVPVAELVVDGADRTELNSPFMIVRAVEGETIARKILRDDTFDTARKVLTSQLGVAAAQVARVGHEAERVAAVAAVGRPRLHLRRIERGLRAGDSRAPKPRRLPGYRISARGIRQVVVEREPQAGAGAGRATGGADAGGVEVPLRGSAADELERSGGILERPTHRRFHPGADRLRHETVVDGDDRDSGGEVALEAGDARLVAVHPAAAVDVEDQRRGPRRIRAPEIEHLPLVGSVGDIGERRRALRRLGLRCLGWFTGAQWRG